MRPPQRVSDHSAAAQVLSLEAKMTVALVRLKQCAVGVRPKELEETATERQRDGKAAARSFLFLNRGNFCDCVCFSVVVATH